jgi:5-hydroxyisourate hydrolase
MGRLTTHVLDTALGRPASGLALSLWRREDGGDTFLKLTDAVTNDDGRVDGPILGDEDFRPGVYELRFEAGDYLRSTVEALHEPLFLDVIPLRFGISDPDAHYHVPLLLSPFGYSTYRGS